MNLLYDLIASQPSIDGDFHGGGKYAKKVFVELVKFNNGYRKIFGLYDTKKPLDPEVKEVVDQYSVELIDVRSSALESIFKDNKIERYYTALPYNIAFNFFEVLNFNCSVMATVHGMRELECPINFSGLKYDVGLKEKLKNITKIFLSPLLRKRDYRYYDKLFEKVKIFTVSNHAKFNILSYYPKMDDSIEVFYSPDVTDEKVAYDDTDLEEKSYFLMISGNRWIKNNLQAALALDELFTDRKDIRKKVVITGVKDKNIYLNRIKNKDRFIFYRYVSEALLASLYKGAFAFVYMTLNEGFGYPPLEAMKHSTPVIASPFTSLTEVCGEAVLYANPFSLTEIKNRALQLLFDTALYEKLQEKSRERYLMIHEKQTHDLNQMVKLILDYKN